VTALSRASVVSLAVDGGAVLLAGSAVLASRGLSDWEARLFRTVNNTPGWVSVACWLPMQVGAGASPVVAGVALATRSSTRAAAFSVTTIGIGAWLAAKYAKRLIKRARPAAYLDNVVVRPGGTARGAGYVSGHAAVATALTVGLWPVLSAPARTGAVVLVALVGFARMQNGSHLPLDVAGGVGLGLVFGALATRRSGIAGP
jgi:membrane-associated phospholipid phosphatase